MKDRKQAEQRALELYPVRMIEREIPKHVGKPFIYEEDCNEAARKAYLKCWDDLNEQQEQKVDYQKMFANCNQPNQLREAAEKVLHTYRNSPTEEPIIEALQELEKALNQNK